MRVLVLGAGIAGLLAARELALRGATVDIADPGDPGGGATGSSAGIVTLQMPEELARWALEAIDYYTGLGSARRTPGVILAPEACVDSATSGTHGAGELARQLTAEEASLLLGVEVRLPTGWSAAYTLDALVDVGGLVSRLEPELRSLGVRIRAPPPHSPYRALRDGYDYVVVAAGAWSPEVLGVEPDELAGSAIYNCEAASVALDGGLSAILYVETGGEAAYAVPESVNRVIVGDGPNTRLESPRQAAPEPGTAYRVLEALSTTAPAFLDSYPIASWAAPCLITGDGLPAVGEWIEGVYTLTGLDGYGLMAAPTLARMLADHLTRGSPLPKPLDPHRRVKPWREGPPPEPFRGC